MVEATYSEDQQLLEKMKEGDDKGIQELYGLYREDFINYAQQNYQLEEEQAVDALQDAMVCLHNNIVKGKNFALTSSLETYLYAIGKNVIQHKFKKLSIEEENNVAEGLTIEIIDDISLDERQQVVSSLLENMEEPCKTILRLFYFKRFSPNAIAQHLEYNNENEAKKQKLRCISILKKMVRERYSGNNF